MHFTYGAVLGEDTDGSALNPIDWVRFLIGDTAVEDPQNQLLSDEEILGCISDEKTKDELHSAAADAAEAVATKFRKFPPTRVGGLANKDPRYIVEQYETLAELLRSHITSTPLICAGGMDQPKAFTMGQFEDTRY